MALQPPRRGLRPNRRAPWRERLFTIIFESDTPAGKAFDMILILTIGISVGVVMLDSVSSVREQWGAWLRLGEAVFTVLFTVEYVVRLLCVREPRRYATSFFGIVDLVAFLPGWIGFFFPGTSYMIIVRVLRILRVFRVLKLGAYLSESYLLLASLRASRKKIEVFLFTVTMLVIIFGSLMYLIEGEENGFTSIPRGVYWAIVTLTTVGYGDITPSTTLGQVLASIIMICGYGIIAVPTGIVSAEMVRSAGRPREERTCAGCEARFHDPDAVHCKYCGEKLEGP
ncbi:ion transporter [Desulfolithobacter sp.]